MVSRENPYLRLNFENMKAKKSLGQHFLKSERALSTIIEAGNIGDKDLILEIGPGQGALTQKLLGTRCLVLAIEKDDELYEKLKIKFKKEISSKRLILIHDDILNFEPENYNLAPRTYKLVANIPYNITGAIFKKFLSANRQPERMVLLVQKEVAKRIVAQNGKESILSISVKAYGTPRYIETVKAGSFAPMPDVDSAIIAVENITERFFTDFREEEFFRMLRAGFKSKRKKLSTNLFSIFKRARVVEVFERLYLNDNLRAEDAGLETWRKLALSFFSEQKRG